MSPAVLDALLAYAHHLGVAFLVVFLAMETALVRDNITAEAIRRVARIDAGIGAGAVLVILAGLGRVFHGLKGHEYYIGNHVFWAKMGLFALVALASLPPTIQFIKWRKALSAEPAFRPTPAKVRMVRMHIKIQWAIMALIPLAAVLMARGMGM